MDLIAPHLPRQSLSPSDEQTVETDNANSEDADIEDNVIRELARL